MRSGVRPHDRGWRVRALTAGLIGVLRWGLELRDGGKHAVALQPGGVEADQHVAGRRARADALDAVEGAQTPSARARARRRSSSRSGAAWAHSGAWMRRRPRPSCTTRGVAVAGAVK